MPRGPRRREKNMPHHIMSRSIPEQDLFREDADREQYMAYMRRAIYMNRVDIVAFCLMDNHVHLLVDPRGGDISKFMRNINNPYARYYNVKYERRGHLYGERFKNIVIEEAPQLLRTSTYIHNNVKDLLYKGYESIADYPYSSIRSYIDREYTGGIVNTDLIFKELSGGKSPKGRNHYRTLLEIQAQGHEAFEKEVEKAMKKGSYESDKQPFERGAEPNRIINSLARLMGEDKPKETLVKYSRRNRKFRCLAALSVRIFCDRTMKEMTYIFKGMTSSAIGQLVKEGYDIICDQEGLYQEIERALRA